MIARHRVLEDRHAAEKLFQLERSCNTLRCHNVGRQPCDIFSLEMYCAGMGSINSGYDVDECALSRPIWADEGHDCSPFHGKAHQAQCSDPCKGPAHILQIEQHG